MSLEKVREIRALKEPKLRPSPYLRESYVDELGEERSVVLRDYQKIGILNICTMPRMILGDDTGLGKTLEILSAIGYIWLVEPEFVPVVVTKKSSLFQWKEEVNRFMKGMEVVVSDGEPYEREAIYADFFGPGGGDSKRIIVMTYDSLLKDARPSVVRDYSHKASKGERAALKSAKDVLKALSEEFKKREEAFLQSLSSRDGAVREHVRKRLEPRDEGTQEVILRPSTWSDADEAAFRAVFELLEARKGAERAAEAAKDAVHPPVKTVGVLDRVSAMLEEREGSKLMVVFDEMHVLKNYRGKMHEAGALLAAPAERVVGMTATPVKNRLMEFFGLFRIVYPGLFPKVGHFQSTYCIVKMQKIPGGRQVPIVIGHTNDQLELFVRAIEPYYLNRRKHEVAKDLPELVTRELECELFDEQEELYEMAEVGLLDRADDPDANSAAIIGSMVLVQEACDAPQLILDDAGEPYQGRSSKLETIVDLLTEELDGVKTLIFSRFERMISLVGEELKRSKIRYERITGKESKASQRTDSKNRFQDLKSGIDVMLITSAGAESLNLHATEQIIFIDNPWSWGDYVQLTGRAIRIGSIRKIVMSTHLTARRMGGGRTIDDHVLKKLREKKRLADKVAGQSLVGGLQFSEETEAMDLFKSIREDRIGGSEAKAAIEGIKKKRGGPRRKALPQAAGKIVVHSEAGPVASVDFSDL